MAKYYVRDTFGYVTVVEAEKYAVTGTTGTFDFFKEWIPNANSSSGQTLAASFPMGGVVSVIESDGAFVDIFPHEEETDPETDDVCLDCRFEDFLDSEAFVTAVAEIAADVVAEYCGTPSEPPPDVVKFPRFKVLKATHRGDEEVTFGFLTPHNTYVDFSSPASAKSGLESYKKNAWGWSEQDPADYTFSEVENG